MLTTRQHRQQRAKRAKAIKNMRPFLTCQDIADVLQIGIRSVQNIVKRGEMTILEIADGGESTHRSYRIDPFSFDRWVAERLHYCERDKALSKKNAGE